MFELIKNIKKTIHFNTLKYNIKQYNTIKHKEIIQKNNQIQCATRVLLLLRKRIRLLRPQAVNERHLNSSDQCTLYPNIHSQPSVSINLTFLSQFRLFFPSHSLSSISFHPNLFTLVYSSCIQIRSFSPSLSLHHSLKLPHIYSKTLAFVLTPTKNFNVT